jgi:aminopeptidase O
MVGKLSHEICHAWFGILVGSLDWTEAWLSEVIYCPLKKNMLTKASVFITVSGMNFL